MTDTLLHPIAESSDVVNSGPSSKPFSRPFSQPSYGPDKRQLARMDTHWTQSSVAVVNARGDIDGMNACALTEYSLADLMRCHGLILDLTRLEFFGAAGFSALHRIAVGCARGGIAWALVPGAAVSLLLRICDPDGQLPAVDTVDAALNRLQVSASDPD